MCVYSFPPLFENSGVWDGVKHLVAELAFISMYVFRVFFINIASRFMLEVWVSGQKSCIFYLFILINGLTCPSVTLLSVHFSSI